MVDAPGASLVAPTAARFTSSTPARPSYSVTATPKLVMVVEYGFLTVPLTTRCPALLSALVLTVMVGAPRHDVAGAETE